MVLGAEDRSLYYQVKYWAHASRASTPKGVQMANLAAHVQSLNPQEKRTFVQKWFSSCGPKGDLTAFIESSMTTK
eukprot:1466111-Amphidinium_carterae.1